MIAPANKTVLPLWVAQDKGFFTEHGLAVAFQSLRPKLSQRDFPESGAYTWEYCNEVLLTRS